MRKTFGLLIVLGVFVVLFSATAYQHGLAVAVLTWLTSIVICAVLATGIRLLID
jgi:hypothetical protein